MTILLGKNPIGIAIVSDKGGTPIRNQYKYITENGIYTADGSSQKRWLLNQRSAVSHWKECNLPKQQEGSSHSQRPLVPWWQECNLPVIEIRTWSGTQGEIRNPSPTECFSNSGLKSEAILTSPPIVAPVLNSTHPLKSTGIEQSCAGGHLAHRD